MDGIDALPLEIWELILSFLDEGRDVALFGSLCTTFFKMTRKNRNYLVKALGLRNPIRSLKYASMSLCRAITKNHRSNRISFKPLSSSNEKGEHPALMSYMLSFLAGLRYVKNETTLELSCDILDDPELMKMVLEMLRNTNVVHLDFSYQPGCIMNVEACSLDFLEEIPKTNLTSLHLTIHPSITPARFRFLCQMLKLEQFKKLSVFPAPPPVVFVLCDVLKESSITHLSINNFKHLLSSNTSLNIMPVLREIPFTKVKKLKLSNFTFDCRRIAGFKDVMTKYTQLRKLSLRNCEFEDHDDLLYHLLNPSFEESCIGQKVLRALSKSFLEAFSIMNTAIIYGNISMAMLMKYLSTSSITELNLSHKWREEYIDIFHEILKYGNIKRLLIKKSELDVGCKEVLECIRRGNMNMIDFSYNESCNFEGPFWKAVQESSLTTLRLRKCRLSAKSVGDLCRVIVNSRLHALDLSENLFDVHDINSLRNAQSLSSMEHLDLRFQKIQSNKKRT